LVEVEAKHDLLSGGSMRGRVADGVENSGVVQRKTIIGNIKEEPREGTAEDNQLV
jgi:hypothetical protein